MSVKPVSALVGNMELLNPSGLPCSPENGLTCDILRLPTSPKELGYTQEKPVASVTDKVHHLLSDRVLGSLVKPLVDQMMMDYRSITTSSPGSSARGTQGSELVVEGNLELPYDLAERVMKDLFLQLLGILLPLSGPAAETSEGHRGKMATNIIATEAINRESANTRDSAAEDSTTSTNKNDIPVDRDDLPSPRFSGVSNFFRRKFSKWRKKTSKVGPALSKKVQT